MKLIIAGGSGLIGQALTKDLVSQGHQVWVLSRNPADTNLPDGVLAAEWDAKTPKGWEHLVSQADGMINLAGTNIGERPWTNERKRLVRSSRMEAGQAIVEAIRQSDHRPRVVMQIAGVGYYGIHGDEPLDEQAPPGTGFLSSVAVDWENSTRPVNELGVRQIILRTGVVLSSKGGVLAPFVLQNRLFAGGPLGSGKQWISWIHLQDLVGVFRFMLAHENTAGEGLQGVFNATSPEPVTNAEFGRTVSRLMHRPYWLPAPAFALRLVLGSMSTLVLDGQRVIPRRLLQMGFEFQFPTLEKALQDLRVDFTK